eukprot:scaffold7520_cov229-Pinguiococcus_pyrenoidosus.AAC.1
MGGDATLRDARNGRSGPRKSGPRVRRRGRRLSCARGRSASRPQRWTEGLTNQSAPRSRERGAVCQRHHSLGSLGTPGIPIRTSASDSEDSDQCFGFGGFGGFGGFARLHRLEQSCLNSFLEKAGGLGLTASLAPASAREGGGEKRWRNGGSWRQCPCIVANKLEKGRN